MHRITIAVLAVLFLAGCDSQTRLTKTPFPPYEGRFVVIPIGVDLKGLEYTLISSFDFQKDQPGNNEAWTVFTVERAKQAGANGIIDFKVGTAFAVWSIACVGPRTTGTMVFFKDLDAAAARKKIMPVTSYE